MNPGKFDLNMYRGDSYTWRFLLWKNDDKDDPVDLEDAIVAAEIRDKPGGIKILPLICVVTQPNVIDVSMTPVMYLDCPTKGVWDLQITFPDGQVHTPVGGSTNVTADVTDSVSISVTALRRQVVEP